MSRTISAETLRIDPMRRGLLLGLGASAVMAGRASADALTDGSFRKEVVAIVKERHPDWPVSVDSDPEQMLIGASAIFLGNLHRQITGLDPAKRRATIHTFVDKIVVHAPGAAAARRETLAEQLARLRIQIIPKEYLDQVGSIAHRPFSDRLRIAYALDESNRYQLLTAPMVSGLGIDPAMVHTIALDNLEDTSSGVAVHVSPTGAVGRFATAATEDGYGAARLALPAFMERVRRALDAPEIVAAVPTRDILIAWTPDSEARKSLADLVRQQASSGPYQRSDELFRFGPKGLQPLDAKSLADHGR